MSMFEFVTVMISMILALCLGHLMRGASSLAKADREVIHHLPLVLWSIVVLLSVINHWWTLWDLRDVDWSYGSFIYMLIAPVLVTFATGLLLPSLSGSGPIDLRAHYSRIRRMFSFALASYATVMWFDGPLFAGQAIFGTVGALHIPIIAADCVPAITDNDRANTLAAGLVIAILLTVMFVRYATM
ncbi:MAG: hypothetical protein ACR2QL_04175 [Woeseiaceae bacterium]